jgi:hypothetical protein
LTHNTIVLNYYSSSLSHSLKHKVIALENESKNKLTYTLFVCVVVSMLLLLPNELTLLLLFDADDRDLKED